MITSIQPKRYLASLIVLSLLSATTGQALPARMSTRFNASHVVLPAAAVMAVGVAAFSGPVTPLKSPAPIHTLKTGAKKIAAATADGGDAAQASKTLFENSAKRGAGEHLAVAGSESSASGGLSAPTVRNADFLQPLPAPSVKAGAGLTGAQQGQIIAGTVLASVLGMIGLSVAASALASRVNNSFGKVPTAEQTADYDFANTFLVNVALPLEDPERLGSALAVHPQLRKSIIHSLLTKRLDKVPNFLHIAAAGVRRINFSSNDDYIEAQFQACLTAAQTVGRQYETDFFSYRHPWVARVVKKLMHNAAEPVKSGPLGIL